MPVKNFLRKITGAVVINEGSDSEDVEAIVAQEPTPVPKKKTKKKQTIYNGQMDSNEKRILESRQGSLTTSFGICQKELQIIYVVILGILIGMIIPLILVTYVFNTSHSKTSLTCFVNESYRFPCPLNTVSDDLALLEERCVQKQCCFDRSPVSNTYSPRCFHSIPPSYGYTVLNVQSDNIQRVRNDIESKTSKTTRDDRYLIMENRNSRREQTFKKLNLGQDVGSVLILDLMNMTFTNSYNGEMVPATVYIQRCSDSVIWLRITATEEGDIGDTKCLPYEEQSENNEDGFIEVETVETIDEQFMISVFRTSNNTRVNILQSVFGPMEYSRDLKSLSISFASRNVYGVGQSNNYDTIPLFSKWNKWNIFSREGNINNTGTGGGNSLIMGIEDDGKSHGIYIQNTGIMQIQAIDIPAILYTSFRGWIDIRVFGGPTPKQVSKQYSSVIGKPTMPPYWALGYHMCRGIDGDDMKNTYNWITDRMNTFSVPYDSDCISTHLGYPNTWGGIETQWDEEIKKLKNENRKFMQVNYPFMDPEIAKLYQDNKDEYIKLPNEQLYYGKVGDEAVVYPDFSNDKLSSSLFDKTFKEADGVILLKNSPLNEAITDYGYTLTNGYNDCSAITPEYCCSPYMGSLLAPTITEGTICWAAVHAKHPNNASVTAEHLEVHNTYGMYHAKAVHTYLQGKTPNKRPFILSSSNYPGSQSYSGYMEEYFGADFVSQSRSQVKITEMGLYGNPAAGLPLCGSLDVGTNTTLKMNEWCLRAHQTGAFHPLMINYYQLGATPRNPAHFSDEYIQQLVVYIRQRYMLIPHIYTQYKKSVTSAAPVLRPLFYEFPEDKGALNAKEQFLLGDNLLVATVHRSIGEENVNLQVYFPKGCWYNLYSGAIVHNNYTSGATQNVTSYLNEISVFLRGGSILPLQGDLHSKIKSTVDAKMKPHHLIVGLHGVGNDMATGELYQDDGETLFESGDPPVNHNIINFEANNSSFTITPTYVKHCDGTQSSSVDFIEIFGLVGIVKNVKGIEKLTFQQDENTKILQVNFNYDWCRGDPLNLNWSFQEE